MDNMDRTKELICFPLNNTSYQADSLGAWFAGRTRGVFCAEENFDVKINDADGINMSVALSPGIGWLKYDEYWGVCVHKNDITVLRFFDEEKGERPDPVMYTCAAVCLQLNRNTNKATAVIKKGFGASAQLALADLGLPVQDFDPATGLDEIFIATINIAPGAQAIAQGDITDRRLEEKYCGIVRDGVERIPTQNLYDAWYAWFSIMRTENDQNFRDWFANLKDLLEENDIIQLQAKLMDFMSMRRHFLAEGPSNWDTAFINPLVAVGATEMADAHVNAGSENNAAWGKDI